MAGLDFTGFNKPLDPNAYGEGIGNLTNTIMAARKAQRDEEEKRARFMLDRSVATAHEAAASGELAVQHRERDLAESQDARKEALQHATNFEHIATVAGSNPDLARELSKAYGYHIADVASGGAGMPPPGAAPARPNSGMLPQGPGDAQMPLPDDNALSAQGQPGSPPVASGQAPAPPPAPAPAQAPLQQQIMKSFDDAAAIPTRNPGQPVPSLPPVSLDDPAAMSRAFGPPRDLKKEIRGMESQDHRGMVFVDQEENGNAKLMNGTNAFDWPLPRGAKEGDWIPDPRRQGIEGLDTGRIASDIAAVGNPQDQARQKPPMKVFNLGDIGPTEAKIPPKPPEPLPEVSLHGRMPEQFTPTERPRNMIEQAAYRRFSIIGPDGQRLTVDPAAAKAAQDEEERKALAMKATGPPSGITEMMREKFKLEHPELTSDPLTNAEREKLNAATNAARIAAARAGSGQLSPGAASKMGDIIRLIQGSIDENGNIPPEVWGQAADMGAKYNIPAGGNKGDNWSQVVGTTVRLGQAGNRQALRNEALEGTDAEGNQTGTYKSPIEARAGNASEVAFNRLRQRARDFYANIDKVGARPLTVAETQERNSLAAAFQAAGRKWNDLGGTDYSLHMEKEIQGPNGTINDGFLQGANKNIILHLLDDAEKQMKAARNIRMRPKNPIVRAAQGQQDPMRAKAQRALDDPNAPPEAKAAARKMLGL